MTAFFSFRTDLGLIQDCSKSVLDLFHDFFRTDSGLFLGFVTGLFKDCFRTISGLF